MIRVFIRYLAYPCIAVVTIAYLTHQLMLPKGELGAMHGLFIAALVLVLVLLETFWPMQKRWQMTARLFLRRDLPFLVIGAATVGAGNVAASWVVLNLGWLQPTAWLSGLPVLPAALLSLLVTDGLWYALHRASHEGKGPLGRWLWRVHAAHHLPQQVYVLMHAVAHPLNTVMVRLILTVPPWLLGVSVEALFAANVVTGGQGLVSHFNVDSRVGVLNHLLVGTELHRWHHAVGVQGNYAAVLPMWDRLFGTYVYRPGETPEGLGVDEPGALPADTEWVRVLMDPMWPVQAARAPTTSRSPSGSETGR